MFSVPPQTRYDLTFSFFGIDVRVHPLFWLIALIFGASPNASAVDILIWVVAVFISILIHEVGHILAMRRFGEDGYIIRDLMISPRDSSMILLSYLKENGDDGIDSTLNNLTEKVSTSVKTVFVRK